MNKKRQSVNVYDKIRYNYSFDYNLGKELGGRLVKICPGIRREELVVSFPSCQVLSRKGKSLGQIGHKEKDYISPGGICTWGENIFISDSYHKRIQMFDKDYHYIKAIPFKYTTVWICCQKDGSLVGVGFNHITIVRPNGETLEKVDITRGTRGVCCNSRDEIIIIDGPNKTIDTHDKNGNFIFSFSPIKDSASREIVLSDVSVDSNDNILVADRENNRILIFTPKGEPIQEITCQAPTGICVLARQIFVAKDDGFMDVFSN